MISLKSLTTAPKMDFADVTSGWKPNGMKIKKDTPQGMYTKKNDVPGIASFNSFHDAKERQFTLGNEFGSNLKKFATGVDYMREGGIDYGSSTSQFGPLGKPEVYRNDEVRTGIRGADFEPHSRISVYNVTEQNNNFKYPHSQGGIGNSESVKLFGDLTDFSKINDLNPKISVEPTKVYKYSNKNFLTVSDKNLVHIQTNNVKDKIVNEELKSGRATQSFFGQTQVSKVDAEIIDRIQIYGVKVEKTTTNTFENNARPLVFENSSNKISVYDVNVEKATANKFEPIKPIDASILNTTISEKLKILDVEANKSTANKFEAVKVKDGSEVDSAITNDKLQVSAHARKATSLMTVQKFNNESNVYLQPKQKIQKEYIPINQNQIPKDTSVQSVDLGKLKSNRWKLDYQQFV